MTIEMVEAIVDGIVLVAAIGAAAFIWWMITRD